MTQSASENGVIVALGGAVVTVTGATVFGAAQGSFNLFGGQSNSDPTGDIVRLLIVGVGVATVLTGLFYAGARARLAKRLPSGGTARYGAFPHAHFGRVLIGALGALRLGFEGSPRCGESFVNRGESYLLPPKTSASESFSKEDRRYSLLLGLPSFALALCLAVLSTYLPVLARRFTSSTAIIGLLVGGEGLTAVLLPIWVGRLSDHTVTRLGRRLPFLLVAAPVAALSLALMPFAPSLPIMAVEVLAFYLAYFTYFSPYRALYPDLISTSASGRAQGIQGVFTGIGLGFALVGGGVLQELWRPLPYLIAGATILLVTGAIFAGLGKNPARISMPERDPASPFAELWSLLRDDRDVVDFVIGNALLTLGLSGLKSFVVLWLTEGLGKSMTFTAVAMAVVAVGTVIGALVSGKLGDKYGPGRVLAAFLLVFGAGLSVGTFTTNNIVLGAAFPVIALSGGAAVSLPYALLLRLTPKKKHGIVAGLFDASSGVGTLMGPALTGIAIDLLRPLFPASHGYSAMWPVLSISVLGAVVVLRLSNQKQKKRADAAAKNVSENDARAPNPDPADAADSTA